MIQGRHPKTPEQALQVVAENRTHGGRWRLVKLSPKPWRRGRKVKLDARLALLQIPYGEAYTDEQGTLQVLVLTYQFDVDNRMAPP